jgi:DNA-binding GntR family transcriptional regulator
MEVSLKGKAYQYLYNAIISHKLKPGEPVVEQLISTELGTSRTPVREALKQLESEGLVRHIPGRGTFVTEVTLQDIVEIFSLREALELMALQVSWNRITYEEIERIENNLQSLDLNCHEEDYYKIDRELHDLIVRRSSNRRLMNYLNTLNSQVERFRQIAVFNIGRLEESKQEHLAFIRSIKERDYDKAQSLLKSHIQNVRNNAIKVYRDYLFK